MTHGTQVVLMGIPIPYAHKLRSLLLPGASRIRLIRSVTSPVYLDTRRMSVAR
jgi:hypothetical protein